MRKKGLGRLRHRMAAAGLLRRVSFSMAVAAAGAVLASCVWIAQGVQVQPVAPAQGTVVTTPVKAHLEDGSTVVYPDGVTVDENSLRGAGDRYNLTLTESERVFVVPLEEVVAMESYRTDVQAAESVLVSALATVGVVGAAALIKVAFGSCPTVYSADGAFGEAELFSSSVAPLFEARDLDRLRARPGLDGTLTLEVRNEAMETHYINHLQVLEVVHGPDGFVLPDSRGRPVVVGAIRPARAITDRSGRDVSRDLAAADDLAYSTPIDRIDAVIDADGGDDLDDWLDLEVAVPPGSRELALVLRLRNSLLGTVFFYNVMLEPMGAAGLDWLGADLDRISTAVELGRWLGERAGLRVSLWSDGEYREVARVADSGPVFWHDVAARIPVPPGETSLALRLSFMADHWRVDRLGVADEVLEPVPRTIGIHEVTDRDGVSDPVAFGRIAQTDMEYLETRPGQNFFAHFSVGELPAGRARTFLLSSLGYYTEWIRGEWIREAPAEAERFDPDDERLLEALREWRGVRDEFEAQFRASRVATGGE